MVRTPTRTPRRGAKGDVWRSEVDGRWHYDVALVRRDGTKFRKAGSAKTEANARLKRNEAFATFNRTQGKGDGWTVRSWCEHCLDQVLVKSMTENAHAVYGYVLRKHAFAVIGGTALADVNIPQLQLFINQVASETSVETAKKVRSALSACFQHAITADEMEVNPARAARVANPRKYTVEEEEESKRILSAMEMKAVIEASKGTPMEPVVMLGMKLGLRLSEALGLPWSNVDLKKSEVIVVQQVKRIPKAGLKLRPPKTAAGKRRIPIPESLKAWLTERSKDAETAGTAWVCPDEKKSLLDPRNATRQLTAMFAKVAYDDPKTGNKVMLNGSEQRPDVTHHDLRSTFLSYMANEADDGKGVPLSVLKTIAGHSKSETTQRYYIRATEDNLVEAMKHAP